MSIESEGERREYHLSAPVEVGVVLNELQELIQFVDGSLSHGVAYRPNDPMAMANERISNLEGSLEWIREKLIGWQS